MSNEFVAVPIARAWDEGPRLRALQLDLKGTDYAARHTAPGQYVRARIPGQKEVFLAIASAPGAPLELLLQKSPAGDPPKPIDALAALGTGDSLELAAPAGKGFPISAERGRDILLLAGGGGISAIRSAVDHVAVHRGDYGKAVLLFGARTRDDLAYQALFDIWGRNRIDVVPVLSRAAADSWAGRTGYVQHCLPELALDPAKVSAFVTGGKAFDAAVAEALGKLGVTRIFRNF